MASLGRLNSVKFIIQVGRLLGFINPKVSLKRKYQEVVSLTHAEVVNAAQLKLGRELSMAELSVIQSIDSLMHLESMYQAFSYPQYLPEQVEKDLQNFP